MSGGGIANKKDAGAEILAVQQKTAASMVNNTAQVSDNFDASPQGAQRRNVLTMLLGVNPTTSGASDSISLALSLEDSADGSTWGAAPVELQPVAPVVIAGGQVTGTTQTVRYDADISRARRYVRVRVTPTLANSAAGTMSFVVLLSGNAVSPGYNRKSDPRAFIPAYAA